MDWIKVMLILIIVVGLIVSYQCFLFYKKKCEHLESEINKINYNNSILRDWLSLKQNSIGLADWLFQNDIKRIAIYGYGILGKALFVELKNSKIEIVCIVDNNYANIYADIPAVGTDNIPNVDAIIITALNYYDEIETTLLGKCNYTIISLEDIVYGVGFKFNE